jgi:hypothetical protein
LIPLLIFEKKKLYIVIVTTNNTMNTLFDESPEITTFEITSSGLPPMRIPGYNHQPSGYNHQPSGYNHQPSGYNHQPSGYNQFPGHHQQPSGYNRVYQPQSQVDTFTTWDTPSSSQLTTFPTGESTQEFHVDARQVPCSKCKGTGRQNIKF